jgi:hypothetical protein
MLQKHFTTQSRSLPLTILAAVTLAVLLVIVAAWPVLKFLTMRRSEQITRLTGLYYALSIALTIMVTVLLVIHFCYGFSDPKADNNMEDLAKAIDANVGRELKQALAVMESVGANSAINDATVLHHEAQKPCTDNSEGKEPVSKTDVLNTVGMEVSEYPYFRRIYVYDSQGFEQVLWTVDAEPPPSLRVCDRPYFQGVQRNDLWYLSDQGLLGARFRVDPVYSKSTGEYLAAIARSYTIKKSHKPIDTGVMMMATPMLALIGPVLPPDYGFAVIDGVGTVLFHSDSTKNGRENFFDELEDSRTLRSAILVRRSTWLRESYMGLDYGLFVTPFTSIQGCPWSLLVFSNRSALGDKALERTVLVALLCGMYLVLLVAVAGLLRLLLPCHQIMWPAARMRGAYCHLTVVLVFVIPLAYALLFESSPKELLCFALLIPASAIGFSLLKITDQMGKIKWTAGMLGAAALLKLVVAETWQGGDLNHSPYLILSLICATYFSLGVKGFADYFDKWKRPSVVTTYSLGCSALLVLIAGISCTAFFKFSYDYDENLATRRQQLLTLAALNRREERVVRQYFNVKISSENGPFADDLGKWLFLRRRLQEQKLDLYDKAFRGQGTGQIMDDEDISRWPGWWVSFAKDWVPHRAASLTPLVADDCVEGSEWRWSGAGTNRIRIQPRYHTNSSPGTARPCWNDAAANGTANPLSYQSGGTEDTKSSPETLALHKLALQDPIFLVRDLTYHVNALRPWDFLRLIGFALAVLLTGLFFSLRSTIKKMFLLNWHEPDVWNNTTLPEAITRGGDRILVGLPRSGKTEYLRSNAGKIAIIDVAVESQGRTVGTVPSEQMVALDHFEYGMTDQMITRWKLSLLEDLVTAGKTILIVTTLDPAFYFENVTEEPGKASQKSSLDVREAARWARILAHFETLRLTGGTTPAATNYYYQLLWSSCTWGEKITLHALAEEGWANYKNHSALQHLLNRGLIEVCPEIRRLLDTTGIWDTWRTTLIVLMLGVLAAVLFLSQKDVLGIISGAIGALTATTRIVSELRSPRKGGGKGGLDTA